MRRHSSTSQLSENDDINTRPFRDKLFSYPKWRDCYFKTVAHSSQHIPLWVAIPSERIEFWQRTFTEEY
jgi:hypothetical protein